MAYAQVSEGYRVGQVNPFPIDPVSGERIPAASHPDKLWNYEIGEKGTYLDGHLLDASAYYIEWERIQLNAVTQGAQINYIANAGRAHIYGGEVSAVAKPWAQWEFGGSLAVNAARLDSVSAGVPALAGDRLPGSAPVSGDIYAQYRHSLGGESDLFARLDGRYVGKEYADLDNPTSLIYGDYASLNLRAGVDWDAYSVTAFVDNVTNSSGKTSAFPVFNTPVAIRQVPLTAGVTVNARF
jgi:outer membrane receptor protein involved in Fe transport